MKENLSKWLIYNLLTAFSFYWLANLLLWFPWSISTNLGITLMLTAAPFLWGLAVYYCLIRYPQENFWKAAVYCSSLFLIVAVIADYIFFGLIRGALEELYHPTTFYGYAFLICLPFLEILFFRKLLKRKKRKIRKKSFFLILIPGIVSLVLLVMIIRFGIRIS